VDTGLWWHTRRGAHLLSGKSGAKGERVGVRERLTLWHRRHGRGQPGVCVWKQHPCSGTHRALRCRWQLRCPWLPVGQRKTWRQERRHSPRCHSPAPPAKGGAQRQRVEGDTRQAPHLRASQLKETAGTACGSENEGDGAAANEHPGGVGGGYCDGPGAQRVPQHVLQNERQCHTEGRGPERSTCTKQRSTTQHSVAHCSATQHNTAQHSTTQHSTTQHSTAQHNTAEHSRAQQSTAEHSRAQQSTAEHSRAQQSTAGRSSAHATRQTEGTSHLHVQTQNARALAQAQQLMKNDNEASGWAKKRMQTSAEEWGEKFTHPIPPPITNPATPTEGQMPVGDMTLLS
jgi:hypothetical protein